MSKIGTKIANELEKKGLIAIKVLDRPIIVIKHKDTNEKICEINLDELWVDNSDEKILEIINPIYK